MVIIISEWDIHRTSSDLDRFKVTFILRNDALACWKGSRLPTTGWHYSSAQLGLPSKTADSVQRAAIAIMHHAPVQDVIQLRYTPRFHCQSHQEIHAYPARFRRSTQQAKAGVGAPVVLTICLLEPLDRGLALDPA